MSTSRERGGIVVGWLLKLVVALAIFGATVFEAAAVIVNKVNVDQVGIDAAQEAGLEYGRSRSSAKAEETAARFAARQGVELLELTVNPDRKSVTITVRKEASTFVIDRIGPLKKYAVAQSTHTGRVG